MAQLTLGQAARLAQVGKTTLTRAIKSGKLSATRRDDGGYLIDPAELQRVYTIPSVTSETPSQSAPEVHHATLAVTPDLTARVAALEAELDGVKALLSEVRQSRDEWKEQAARLALAGPASEPRSWWPWRRRA